MSQKPMVFADIVNEQSTAQYTGILKDETGASIPVANVGSLTLTLTNVATGAIINGRNAQDVLNQNQVTLDGNGRLTYTLQPADTAIQDATNDYETHRATFICLFNAGAGKATWDVDILIRNLSQVS